MIFVLREEKRATIMINRRLSYLFLPFIFLSFLFESLIKDELYTIAIQFFMTWFFVSYATPVPPTSVSIYYSSISSL